MPRSQWKPLLAGQSFSVQSPVVATSHAKVKDEILTVSRSAQVNASLLGKTVYVHTGKAYLKVTVSESMLHRKFGEFALTRRLANHAKKTKKRKN